MCAIAGFLRTSGTAEAAAIDAVTRMTSCMQSRGPDSKGLWARDALVLGHRRLAILDLDPRADQPMVSPDGRYTVVYNGEVYNFKELRQGLQETGTEFRTTSDTEVILALFARSGEAMLTDLRGMFAFAIWDALRQKLFVARDPYGIKPLYIAKTRYGVLISSQVRALISTGLVSRDPNPIGQAGFWLLGSVPEPHTWFKGITMLPAGHYAWISSDGLENPRCFANIAEAWRQPSVEHIDARDAQQHASACLREAVQAHLIADVPVGVFLSGGIDSASLAALMAETGYKNPQAVTVAFDEYEGHPNDETPVASSIAGHYGITHHIRKVTLAEFKNDLPQIVAAIDQPSVDGVNTWYACKAAAEVGLKVVMSGLGGDEIFRGYRGFELLPRTVSAWRNATKLPGMTAVAKAFFDLYATRSGNPRWRLFPELAKSIPGAWFLHRGLFAPEELPGLMGHELACEALSSFSPESLVRDLTGPLPDDAGLAVGQIESVSYLRNQLLRDSDWASMSHSVELRTPFVDTWLLRELSPLLPQMNRFPHKSLLSNAPLVPLPSSITSRPKTGFGIPIQRWLEKLGKTGFSAGYSREWAREVARTYSMANW